MFYIISDTHFNHNNICGPNGFIEGRRCFENAKEMNEWIIKNFNAKVHNDDHTYHLGDISLNSTQEEVHLTLNRLKGSFTFILGNHDSKGLFKYLESVNYRLPSGRMKYSFEEVGLVLKHKKRMYYLTHYPLLMGDYRPLYRNLCGHIHDEYAPQSNGLNVGIDSPELPERPFGEPIALEDAFDLVERKWSLWKHNNTK